MMHKIILAIAAFSMALAVALGALGAHALQDILTPDQLSSFQTGVRYQAWHSLALIAVIAVGRNRLSPKAIKSVCILFCLGILFFCFSIYLLNLREYLGIQGAASILGPITPLGGIMFIAGWLLLGVNILRHKTV